jgi:hypothetical protein
MDRQVLCLQVQREVLREIVVDDWIHDLRTVPIRRKQTAICQTIVPPEHLAQQAVDHSFVTAPIDCSLPLSSSSKVLAVVAAAPGSPAQPVLSVDSWVPQHLVVFRGQSLLQGLLQGPLQGPLQGQN